MMQELAALINQYGLLVIFALVLLEQLGLPLPALPALVVAGALAAGGELALPALFGSAVLACLAGDAAWSSNSSRQTTGPEAPRVPAPCGPAPIPWLS